MGIVQLPFPPGKYTEKGTGQVPQKNKTFGGSLVCKPFMRPPPPFGTRLVRSVEATRP